MTITSISSLYSVASVASSTPSTRPMTVQKALQAIAKAPGTQVDVSDTAQNISKYWDRLKAGVNSIGSLSLSDMSQRVNITADQFVDGSKLRDLFTNEESFEVSGTVHQLSIIADDSGIQAISVLDSTANIQNNFSTIASYGSKLKAIKFNSPVSNLQISQDDYLGTYSSLLKKLPTNVSLQLTGVSVENAPQILNDRRVRSLSISDTIENVQQNIDKLNSYALKISGVQNTSESSALYLTAGQFKRDAAILNKIVKGYDLQLHASSISSANDLKSNKLVEGISIVDTVDNVRKNIKSLNSGFGGKLNDIILTDPDSALKLSYNDVIYNKNAIDHIASDFRVELTNRYISADQLLTLNDSQPEHFADVKIADSAANINSKLVSHAQQAWLMDQVKSITTTDTGAVNADIANTAYISKFTPGTRFDFGDLGLDQFLYANKIGQVAPTRISATAAEVQQNFSALAKLNSSVQSITLTEGSNIVLPKASISQNSSLIGKILTSGGSNPNILSEKVSIGDFLGGSHLGLQGGAALYGTAADLQANFAALANYKDQIDAIDIEGGDAVLTLTQQAVQSHADLIKKITGNVIFKTADTPQQLADGSFLSAATLGFQSSTWNQLDNGSSANIDGYVGSSKVSLSDHNYDYYNNYQYNYYYNSGPDSAVYQNTTLAAGKYLLSFNVSGSNGGAYDDVLSFGLTSANMDGWNAGLIGNTGSATQASTDIAADIKAGNAQTLLLNGQTQRINFEFDVSTAESSQDLKLFFRKNSGNTVSVNNVSLLKIA